MPAPSAPYIPARDADFDAWLVNFSALITANPTSYGLVAGDATAIDAVADDWALAYPLATNPTTRTPVTVAGKDVARVDAEAVVRPYAQVIRSNAAISDALKTGLGLNLQPVTLTPIPAPTSNPVLGLIGSTTGQSRINFHDSVLSGKTKPYGCKQVDIHAAFGTVAVSDPADAAYFASVNKSPAVLTWPGEHRGKLATIFARYRTQSGPGGAPQFGPWSEALVVTVS